MRARTAPLFRVLTSDPDNPASKPSRQPSSLPRLPSEPHPRSSASHIRTAPSAHYGPSFVALDGSGLPCLVTASLTPLSLAPAGQRIDQEDGSVERDVAPDAARRALCRRPAASPASLVHSLPSLRLVAVLHLCRPRRRPSLWLALPPAQRQCPARRAGHDEERRRRPLDRWRPR